MQIFNRSNIFILILVLAIFTPVAFSLIRDIQNPDYQRLTMYFPDGTKRIFVGCSIYRDLDAISFYTKDGKKHTYKGHYMLDMITKEEFDDFLPTPEI